MPFSPVTITGYNANPPEDDGSATATNEISWAKHKDKIGDPLKTGFDALVTELTETFDELFGVLMAAAGTDLLFAQATAPTGWTKQVTHNNKALRLVTGATGGSAAGTTAFTSVFAARTVTQANLPVVNLSSASLTGGHSLTLASGAITNGTQQARNIAVASNLTTGGSAGYVVSATEVTISLSNLNVVGTVTVGGSVPLGGSGTAMDFAVQYVDLIWCTKA